MVSEAARRFAAKRGLALAYPPDRAGDVGDMGDTSAKSLETLDVLPCAGVTHPVAGGGYMGDSADRPRPVPPVGEGSVTHVTQGPCEVGDGPQASGMADFRSFAGGVTHVTRVTQPNGEAGPDEPRRKRPPAWSDASNSPGAGDVCGCCRGRWWWADAGGWRCWTCHPAVHVAADKRGELREART